jgi:hypothetical protein
MITITIKEALIGTSIVLAAICIATLAITHNPAVFAGIAIAAGIGAVGLNQK